MGFHISFTILNPLLVLLLALCSKGCVETERLALLDFKISFTSFSQNHGRLSSWNSSHRECCSWEGISCDNHTKHVVSLDLSNQGLESYQLRPPSLLELQHLRRLDLSWNELIATRIPEFIGSLSKLTYLDLSFGGFFGMIPPPLGNLSNLQTLYLRGNELIATRFPEFIGSLGKLTYLDLSDAGFFGMIPPQLGNLSSLHTLYLYGNQLSTDNFQWLSRLSSLERIDMSSVNFSEARDCLSVIMNLPSLSEFTCWCNFPTDPDLSSHVNSSSSLQTLDLSYSNLSSTVLSLLINGTNNLKDLYLSRLNLEVPFPDVFHDMITLNTLDLSFNQLVDGIFNSIGNLCNLVELFAPGCIIKESLANILQALSSCASYSLERILFSSMNLTGTIPPMLKFQSLMDLDLGDNRLDSLQQPDAMLLKLEASNISSRSFMNGSLLNTLPLFPANLTSIVLDNNNLNGVLSDVHFTNLSQLQELHLANNHNLTVSFNKPLAGARRVYLSSCNLDPNFPSWLLTNSISELDISHCMISGTIPIMFWRNLSPSLIYLNLSSNRIYGIVPNIPFQFSHLGSRIGLSSNLFCGPIPYFFFQAAGLYLSNNHFSGFAPIPRPSNFSSYLPQINFFDGLPSIVDLSNNLLSGLIPNWLRFPKSLTALNLANNNLSGTIPSSIGQAVNLYVLSLRNNNFSGLLPPLLKNCSELRILDLGGNHFSGFIPSWIGENLKNLSILSLGSNSFTGFLPTSLCHLSSLQILDLSYNMLLGNIPSCVHDFSAMAHDVNSSLNIFNFEKVWTGEIVISPLEDVSYYNAYIKWKSKVWKFQSTLHLVKLIDLSSNNLTGEIPKGLTSLVELDSIDLSCNSLQGSIPAQIGQLKSLQVLNLSSNRLCGQIPQSLSEISALEMLDLSHNNLSGRIPKGTQLQTFNSSAFAGNPQLCGLPLRQCPRDGDDSVQPPQPSPTDDSKMQDKWANKQCFYAGLGAGFACGFFGILGTLNWIRKWRIAFFQFSTNFGEWILVVVALSISKMSRKL